MIDSHCHIHYLEDIDGALRRLEDIDQIMVIVDAAAPNPSAIIDKIKALRSKTTTRIRIAIGCHPCSVDNINLQELCSLLDELLPQVDCLGEVGLDFSRKERNNHARQFKFLQTQCKYAERYGKSANFHARGCTMEELIGAIKDYKINKILHCNTFPWKDVQRFVNEVDGFVSFSGIVTFKNKVDHIREAAAKIPLNKILFETDAPFLTPEPKRGKTNEPQNVALIYKFVAKLRAIDLPILIDQVHENFTQALEPMQ